MDVVYGSSLNGSKGITFKLLVFSLHLICFIITVNEYKTFNQNIKLNLKENDLVNQNCKILKNIDL